MQTPTYTELNVVGREMVTVLPGSASLFQNYPETDRNQPNTWFPLLHLRHGN